MKKNSFQGFCEKELKKLEMVNGGISYGATSSGGQQVDEEAYCMKGEYDPWNEQVAAYNSIDYRWDDCSGISSNPGGITSSQRAAR